MESIGYKSIEYSLDSLKLEFLILLLKQSSHGKVRLSYWHQIDLLLEKWTKESVLIAPFSPELLHSIKSELLQNRPYAKMYNAIADSVEEIQSRVNPIMPHIRSLALQIISPWGNNLIGFIQHVDDFERKIKKALKRGEIEYWPKLLETSIITNPEVLKSKWEHRLLWPGRSLEGSWSFSSRTPTEIESDINVFWDRLTEIVFAFDILEPLRPLLLCQLRKHLSWHFLLVPDNAPNLCLPIPVFPVLLPGRGRGIKWLNDKKLVIEIGSDFKRQINHALLCGIDTWVSRNKTWIPEKADGDVDIKQLWNSTLMLDIREVVHAWRDLDLNGQLKIDDRSAGISVGVGIIGLLSGQIPNEAVWCSGPISDPVMDQWKRRRSLPQSLKEPFIIDAKVRWDVETTTQIQDLSHILKAKLMAARIHGIAQRIVLPENSPPEAIEELRRDSALRDISAEILGSEVDFKPSLGIHPVRIPTLSTAADAALPVTYRKYRYINAPDLKWAFSITHGKLNGKDNVTGYELLDKLAKYSIVYVQASAWGGKSYSIAQALTVAREELRIQRRTGPRVAFVRIPDGEKGTWELESWRIIMTHLSFPNKTIERFFWAGNYEKMARVFVEGFRECPIDVLVLSGIDRFYDYEDPFPRSRSSHLPRILLAISQLLKIKPIERDPAVSEVLGLCEIVLEIRSKQKDDIPIVSLDTKPWNVEEAWAAIQKFFESDFCIRTNLQLSDPDCQNKHDLMKNLLGALSIFPTDFGSNGLYLITQHLNIEEKLLNILLRGKDQNVGLRDLHLIRWPSAKYSILTKRELDNTIFNNIEDSGPLIREGQGHWHIHPLIRDSAFEHFKNTQLSSASRAKNWEKRCFLSRLHFNVASRYFMPILSEDSYGGLLPLEALMPESLIFASQQLAYAFTVLKGAHSKTKGGLLKQEIRSAQLRLLRYYQETSTHKAASLSSIKGAESFYKSKQELLAYKVIKEFLDNHPGPHHPIWWVLRARIAESIVTSDIPPSYGNLEWKLEEAERCLLHAHTLKPSPEEQKGVEIYVKSALISFLCRHRDRFRLCLPDGFSTPNEAIDTFYKIIADPSSQLIIRSYTYSDVGELLWDEGRKDEASRIWKLGFECGKRSEAPFYPLSLLLVRALGSLASLGNTKSAGELIDQEEWFRIRSLLVQPYSSTHPKKDRWTREFLPYIDQIFPPLPTHNIHKNS